MKEENWIEAIIAKGNYKGKKIEVKFGKPLKILCNGEDISDAIIALRIDLSVSGQIIYLKIAEEHWSQFSGEQWRKACAAY